MNRSCAIELLTRSKPILAVRYGVTELALFGSTARDADRGFQGRAGSAGRPGCIIWTGLPSAVT